MGTAPPAPDDVRIATTLKPCERCSPTVATLFKSGSGEGEGLRGREGQRKE